MKTTIVILLYVSTLLFSFGCKKKSKELTTVNFHLYNPVTNEAFSGIKVSVLQEKNTSSGFNSSSDIEVIWEGVTDAYGKAAYTFKAYNSTKYAYWQTVEQSFYFNSSLHKVFQPEFLPLNKNEENEIVYKVVKNANMVTWLKNLNCFDQNDQMRWRRKSIVDIFDDWSVWTPFSTSNNIYFEGCYELISNPHTYKQDIWDVEMEVTKNGITSLVRDTFYITGQNGTDTLKLFY